MNDSPLSPEAVAQMVADRDDVFLIMKRDLYYRPNAQGYTGIKDHAGRYTLEQVAAMFPNMDSPHQDGTEFIRECDAQEYTKACYHDLKEAHQAQRLATLAAENAMLRAERDMLKFDIDKMLTQIEGHNAAWDELRASEAAANARADQARDAALVEAAGTLEAQALDAEAQAKRFRGGSDPWADRTARSRALRNIADTILALRDKPAPAVTVDAKTTPTPPDSAELDALVAEARERARDEFAAGHMNDAVFHGNVADAITTLRDTPAIAGGGDE